jgi:hypothetical protein
MKPVVTYIRLNYYLGSGGISNLVCGVTFWTTLENRRGVAARFPVSGQSVICEDDQSVA